MSRPPTPFVMEGGDRGIDGIFVDHDSSEIIFLQVKTKQREDSTIGDAAIRDFAGSIAQFDTSEKVAQAVLATPDADLAKLLVRSDVESLLAEDYTFAGAFITNSSINTDGQRASESLNIKVYDRQTIAAQFIEIEAPEGVKGSIDLDISDSGFSKFDAGGQATLYITTVRAKNLLEMHGFEDGSLFSQNVRLNLGRTRVNKDIKQTVLDQSKHMFFPMYHNGITLICADVDFSSIERLRLTDYVVVNGAQSLSVLFDSREYITDDLRLVVKIIENDDPSVSADITLFSNNQNAIRPRDQRSNHLLQVRLKQEFENVDFEGYRYIIKRGEEPGEHPILNEDAGRMLLAFDLKEPWSCHQIYKVFDEKHAEIFGRPSVDAWRIILLTKIMETIEGTLAMIGNEPIQNIV